MIRKAVLAMEFNYEKIMDRHFDDWKRSTIKNRMIKIYFRVIKERNDQILIKKYFYKYVKKYSKSKKFDSH